MVLYACVKEVCNVTRVLSRLASSPIMKVHDNSLLRPCGVSRCAPALPHGAIGGLGLASDCCGVGRVKLALLVERDAKIAVGLGVVPFKVEACQ
jgi:hypothetical protein